MPSTYRKKLIEVALPLSEINDASAYDKMPGIGPHPKGLHQWWARLPLPAARAVLFASIVDDPSSDPHFADKTQTEQAFERERLFNILRSLMQKKLHLHPEIYEAANQEMLRSSNGILPGLLDPFAGGGSIPLEATRLGLKTYASDLNPVAVLINKCLLEIAPRWAQQAPVNSETRGQFGGTTNWPGTTGLAQDIKYFGRFVLKEAAKRIQDLYPRIKPPQQYGIEESDVVAWLWARAIKCPNPACQARMPLVRSFWLAKKKTEKMHAHPILNQKNKTVRFEIKSEGQAEVETTTGKGARCLFCNAFLKKAQVRDQASQYGITEIPLAVVCNGRRSKIYLSSESVVAPNVEKPRVAEVDQPMTNDRRWFSPPLYGLPHFGDLFTSRQLTTLTTLSDLIRTLRSDIASEARAAGMPSTESEDYSKAVITFLSLGLDRCIDFNNSLCTWNSSNEKVMHLFGRQAIPMTWDFAEANTLGDAVGGWLTCCNYVAECVETLGVQRHHEGITRQIDATSNWNDAKGLLVSTDPPYYDNIGYAALSDFFYVWLRRTVGDLYPTLFQTILVPKMAELTALSERFGGDKQKARDHFEEGFRKAFADLQSKIDPRFPLTVYYAFKQEDEQVGTDGEIDSGDKVDLTSGWETLLNSLLSSGFQITGTWPVRASQAWRMVSMGTNALASYIVLVCRPRHSEAQGKSRRDFLVDLKNELPNAIRHLQAANIAPVDLAQAAIGPGMAVFSKYARVLEADGSLMTVRTALQLINQTLDEVLAEQEGEFDGDTRWALAWFEQYGAEEGPFGVAETLSKAKNTAVNGLVEAGIISASRGKVCLLKRDELPDDWDPASDTRLTIWEVVQHLIRTLEQKGEQEAATLVKRLGGTAETARDLAYRLYTICERKKWAQEALAYNGLVIAWPEITRLASGIKPEAAKDKTLFEQE